MDHSQDPYPEHYEIPEPQKRSIWQKLGAGALSISIIFHAILLIIGVIWVLQVIPAPPKVVDFMPPSGGGGSPASESKAKQHRVQMMQPNMARVVAQGASSSFTLPEPDEVSQMSNMGSLSSGGLAGGLGGPGSGGGKGDGNGPGFGSGMAPGLSSGTGGKNPFGMISPDRGALVGTFYDLKQDSKREPTDMTDDQMRELLPDIVKRGFKDSVFRKYYKASRVLYQTKFHIPLMSAEGAPAAFECEKEVQPRRWLVTYSGGVVAPKTGKFRFVGQCDDILVIRFNNRPVFDYGYTIASTGTHMYGRADEVNGTKENEELTKQLRRASPMTPPIKFYRYESTPAHNKNVGGFAVGPEFSVEAGRTYPIEILIGEIPGGFFSLSLMIEEVGATYEKDPAGFPILPLFQLDANPPAQLPGEQPPIAPNGPIWKFAAGATKRDI